MYMSLNTFYTSQTATILRVKQGLTITLLFVINGRIFYSTEHPTQQTRYTDPMRAQCWASVKDVGQTCSLGILFHVALMLVQRRRRWTSIETTLNGYMNCFLTINSKLFILNFIVCTWTGIYLSNMQLRESTFLISQSLLYPLNIRVKRKSKVNEDSPISSGEGSYH